MPTTLVRPTMVSTPAFDATQEHTFTFVVQGSTAQITANRLTIRNQDTNDIVYQEQQETFRYAHVVNADELTNNTYYNATVVVIDAEGNESPESTPIQFWCYTTPTVEFDNLPENNIIQNASFNFQFTYNQVEGEAINSYIMNLYDSSGAVISTSGIQYATNGTPPYNGSYLYAGFENATAYSIELQATTVNGTIVSTGLVAITVQYTRPDLFTLLELTNNCDEGYISIRSNIILVEGESNPDPPTYIDNEEVDLRQDGSYVEWNEGYSISGDYLTRVWFRDPTPNTTIVQFSTADGQTIQVNYREGYENVDASDMQGYIEVYVQSYGEQQRLAYYVYSNFVDIQPDTGKYMLWLNRVNYIYDVRLAIA